jgi:hypothetical protein
VAEPSMPQSMPGQANCPPGQRPIPRYPGMPEGASACAPVGPAVPQGGWKPSEPGYGPGYPPTGEAGVRALNDLLPSMVGAGRGDAASYASSYADWRRGMAR